MGIGKAVQLREMPYRVVCPDAGFCLSYTALVFISSGRVIHGVYFFSNSNEVALRIIAYTPKNSGPSYHRIAMPLMLMDGPDVFCTNDMREVHFEKGCDLFMYNRVLPKEGMEQFNALRKKYGFKVCVDVDDLWELDPHHILYRSYIDDGFAERQIHHLRQADVILTTHERLAEEIRSVLQLRVIDELPYVVRPEVHVCPNAIPRLGQFDIKRERHDLVRLFWQGSITHHADIELLYTPIESLRKISGKIKMIMAGYQETEDTWRYMARVYTDNLKHQYKLLPGAHVAEYYAAYAHADICLVPLVNSRFNRMKSNLKILEAANMGLPVIASGVHPYLGMPVNFCKNSRDWIGHIKRLVQYPGRRQEEGQRLAEYCAEHYNFHKINNERRQILEYVASKVSV